VRGARGEGNMEDDVLVASSVSLSLARFPPFRSSVAGCKCRSLMVTFG